MTRKPIVIRCFNETIRDNSYDLEKANLHQQNSGIFSMDMFNAISEISRFVNTEHAGCCLHYALYLTSILEDSGIMARFATVPDSDGNGNRTHKHCCVWYESDGEQYIADPVESIKQDAGLLYCFIPVKEYLDRHLKEGENLSIYMPLEWHKNNMNFSDFLENPELHISMAHCH